MDKIELLGGACFSHGPYTFYKAVRISNNRVLRLGSFFLTKLWSDADLVSIGELQLLWIDSRGPNTPLASLRLYFLPENTPDGRRDTHGEDEVLTISEKVVVRVHDLVTWLSPSLEWSWGREVSYPPTPSSSPDSSPHPQVLSDPGLDFSDVERHQKDLEALATVRRVDATSQTKVVVLSYPRYCRYRALLQRLAGSEPSWLCSSIAAALGGFTALPGTRVLFCRDTFDYPDLETHELLCNHLAPKLKGRPRRKRKKRSVSPGESSNESEASVASSVAASSFKGSSSNSGQSNSNATSRPISSVIRRSERKTSAEEKRFVNDVQSFMTSRNTPLGKMPLLGYRQIDLFLFYTKVQDLGGYDRVSANRLWKLIYDEMGGNTGSTSAATITRRHYERLLLPYERCQKGEEIKVRPNHGSRRIKTPSISDVSEDSIEVKREVESPPPSETPPPTEITNSIIITPPPLQSILTTSSFMSGEKPRLESGKTSSLRSVRVKPERLKSLNTIIATSNPTPINHQLLSSSPGSLLTSTTSSNTTSSSSASSPTSTPPTSTTPTNGSQHSVLERQLNSPLLTQQVLPSCSPPGLPVSTVATNATTVVTLTPPPEKDMKEIKLDSKQMSLLAHGKENIPLFEEKSPIFVDKPNAPRSPEVIDLETENETGTRDKLIIPSFKKRKLEILREGGLEVTPVELDARPSVIQPITTTNVTTVGVCLNASVTTIASPSTALPLVTAIATIASSSVLNQEEKPIASSSFAVPPTTLIPKLINVTVTPDIGRILARTEESRSCPISPIRPQPLIPVKQHQRLTNQGSNDSPTNQLQGISSRVINLGSSNNATLLQLYANANVPVPHSLSAPVQTTQRFVTPSSPMTNGRPLPLKVTQSRSIFGNTDKMVYGNPKDIIVAPKYLSNIFVQPHSSRNSSVLSSSKMQCGQTSTGVLDLTQKLITDSERSNYGRPNLEIVRVPVIPRPNPLNLEIRHRSVINHSKVLDSSVKASPLLRPPPSEATSSRKGHCVASNLAHSPAGYTNVLDNRTMTTNNLEITLVSSKKSSGTIVCQRELSPPSRNNNVIPSTLPIQRRQQQQQNHINGKYPSRLLAEPVSPYTPRKPVTISGRGGYYPVIPNIPNLSHLNAGGVLGFTKANQSNNYQQMTVEKKKASLEMAISNKDHQRRISEGDKISIQQQQQRIESGSGTLSKHQQSRDSEAISRRHSVPSLPTGFMSSIPQNSSTFLAHQLVTATNNSSSTSSAAAAAAAAGKFLPILDPMYYSAFYNGLFSGPVPASTGPNPFLPPELSAYYKELLASSSSTTSAQQTRLQHQPAAPTSK